MENERTFDSTHEVTDVRANFLAKHPEFAALSPKEHTQALLAEMEI
jgi:hypothetical protein